MIKSIRIKKLKITTTLHHRWESIKKESDKFHKKKWNTNFDLGIWLARESEYRRGVTIGINLLVLKIMINFKSI